MADYANDLFESIKVMTDAAISKINFDRTEIYTIVSPVENEEYCYNVTNGTYTFKAYSNNYQEYKNGASVYVQIPQNDYSQTKFIVGEAGTKGVGTTENYLSPLDNIVVFAKQDKINLGTKYNFKENGFFPYIDYSWNKNDVELEAKHFRLGIYTEIQNVGNTKFGLKVTAFNEDSQRDNNETSNEIIWSCEDMYGDYRKYYYPFPQEFLHSFSGTGFQIDLVTQEEGKDEWTKLNEKSEKPKPQISNISVFIGYSQEAFKRETLIIGSTEYLIGPKTTNPTLKAFWIRKNNLGYYHVEEDEKQFKFALGEELSLLNNFNQLPQVDWSKYENNKPNNLIPIQWIDMAEGNDINKWGKDLKELLDNKYIEYSAQETNQISFVKEKGLNEEKLLELKELKEYLNNSSNLKTQKTILTLWLTNSENYVKIYKSEQNNYKVRLQLNLTKGEVFNKPKDIKLKFAALGLASNNIYKVDSWFEGSEASIELDETDLHYYLIINFHCNIKPGQTIPDDLIIGEDEFGEYYQFTVLKIDDEKTNSLFPIQVTMSECNFGVFSWFGGRIDEDPLRKTSSVSLNSAANTSLKWYQYNNNIKADKTTGDLDNWKRIWQTEIIEQEDPETLEKKEVEIKTVKFITPVNLQETFLTQTFKCVIEDKPNIFQKEIVYSQSVETEEENNTKQAEEGYSIELLDTSGGNYYSYDHTGNKIANNSYTGSYGLKVISNKGNTIETVRWYFPKYDSMITAKNHGSGEYKTIVTNGKEEQQEIPYWETSYLEKSSYTKTHDTYWKSYKNDKVSVSKTIQYELSQYYDPSKSNNTVICYVNNEHKLTKTFNFGTAVAQGAEYDANLTLIHTKKNENGEWVEDTDKSYEKKCWYGSEIYGNIDKNNPSEVENKDGNLWFRLNIRNRLGTIINNNNVKATWQFLHWPGKYVYKNIEGVEKTDTFVYHSEEFQPEPNDETGIYKFSIPKVFNFAKQLKPANNITAKLLDNYASYTVVKIIFKINNIVYTKYFPIPLSDNNNIWFVSAPNYITYDPTGTNPKYNESKEGIKIFYIPDKNDSIALNIENVIEDKTVKQAKVIKSPDNDGMFTNSYVLDEKTYEPTTTLKSITPPATMAVMPPERIQYRFKLSNIVKGDSLNNEAKNYHHPIIIQQDLWSSDLLNKWDSGYKIDKNGKNAFFANVGAGSKNSDNSFTGVLMGTYQGDNNAYGLYGFKDGANIFKLNNDGEFFIGKEESDAKGNDIGTYLKFNSSTSEFKLRANNFNLNATNLKLTSNLSDANTNKIGNWILTPSKLYCPKINNNYGTGIASKAGNDWVAFWAGYKGTYSEPFAQYDKEKNTNWQNATNFYVLNNGTMVTKSGKIGPWNFTSSEFYSDTYQETVAGTKTWCKMVLKKDVCQFRYTAYEKELDTESALRTGISTTGGVYVDFDQDGGKTSYAHWLRPNGTFYLGNKNVKYLSFNGKRLELQLDYLGIFIEDNVATFGLVGATPRIRIESGGYGQLYGSWKSSNGSWSTTSDLNKKNTITPITSDYSVFFDDIQPVTYKYNDGTSNRLHTGFIAQQIVESLNKANISTQDFAGLTIFNMNTENEEWCLRYEEFIALNTNEIQKLKKRVNQLETEVSSLKEQFLNI